MGEVSSEIAKPFGILIFRIARGTHPQIAQVPDRLACPGIMALPDGLTSLVTLRSGMMKPDWKCRVRAVRPAFPYMSERPRFHPLAIPNKKLVIVTKGTPRSADCLLPDQRVAALGQFGKKYSYLSGQKFRRKKEAFPGLFRC